MNSCVFPITDHWWACVKAPDAWRSASPERSDENQGCDNGRPPYPDVRALENTRRSLIDRRRRLPDRMTMRHCSAQISHPTATPLIRVLSPMTSLVPRETPLYPRTPCSTLCCGEFG